MNVALERLLVVQASDEQHLFAKFGKRREHLAELPELLPEPFDVVVARPVHPDCRVHFEGRQYPVPFEHVDRMVAAILPAIFDGDREELEKIAAMELVAKTDKTIVDKERLLQEIQITKERGFALADEEYLPGVLAIAAPLYDPINGMGVGAVSFDFSVLQHTGPAIMANYGEMIQQTASILSELLPAVKKHR